MRTLPPGTAVTVDLDTGTWHGRAVVCLCKRHVWQEDVADAGPGRECLCGGTDDTCPRPMHVVWENGLTESHEAPRRRL